MAFSRNNHTTQTAGMPMSYAPFGTMGQMQAVPGMAPSMPGMTPALPSGVPSGPSYGGAPLAGAAQAMPAGGQVPQTVQSSLFVPGLLRNYIGRTMRVEFLIGTNGPLVDRIGTLLEVGASYIMLRPVESDDILVCDLYSIKFVTISF